MNDKRSENWNAWINMMPPGPPTLHVAGTLDVGNESDSATLVFDSLEKSNPPNLVLRIEPKTIFIPRDPGDHTVHLHYSQLAMPGQIGTIKVVYPDGDVISIDNIGIAH